MALSTTGTRRKGGKRARFFKHPSNSLVRHLAICRMQIWRPAGFDGAPLYVPSVAAYQEVDPLVRLVLAENLAATPLSIDPWWEYTVKTATSGPESSQVSHALRPPAVPLQIRGAGMDSPYRPYLADLSEREWEILLLVAEGLSNKGIADRLIIAESTVKWYLKQIYLKLDVHNRAQAIRRLHALT